MYKIILEEPPVARTNKSPNSLSSLLAEVAKKHPGQWVRLSKGMKSHGYVYILRRKRFPNMEIVTRKNPNGTFGVWVRFHSEPVQIAVRNTK